MIRGVVTRYEGIVRLSVFGRRGQRETVEAVVDLSFIHNSNRDAPSTA